MLEKQSGCDPSGHIGKNCPDNTKAKKAKKAKVAKAKVEEVI